jgi:uncharacterized protein
MLFVDAILHALQISLFMLWEVLWPLAFGFLLSAIVQTVVSKRAVARVLGKPDFKGFILACGFGAASSSCSYAAVAVARTLFRRGAHFVNAMIFEFASTNLVFELGLVLLVLLGWQFVAAEFAGGLLMALILWIIFKVTLRERMVEQARRQAERGIVASTMEGHGEMDMSITEGPFVSRLLSPRAFTAISHYFYMDLYSLYIDLGLGFLIAGALAAWVPNSVWQAFFLTHDPVLNEFWGPLIGPVISMLSFVCSVGNVPLAVVLWNGGISFGGVISFIFADLIILPILNIYRKYYGGRMSLYLLLGLLRRDGARRLPGRWRIPAARMGAEQPPRGDLRDRSDLELHDCSRHRRPRPHRSDGVAIPDHGALRDAALHGAATRDEGQSGHRPCLRNDRRRGDRQRECRVQGHHLLLLLSRLQIHIRERSDSLHRSSCASRGSTSSWPSQLNR